MSNQTSKPNTSSHKPSLWHPNPFVSTPPTNKKPMRLPLLAIVKMHQVKPATYKLPHFKCSECNMYYKVKVYREWKPNFWEREREVCKFCLTRLEGTDHTNAVFNRRFNKSPLELRLQRKRRKPSNKK